MKKSHALASAALILWGVICPVAAQTWISTWAAPAFARVDQPAQTLSSTARAFPWSQYVPTAAAGQELVVAGASLLHFKDQTIRQIAHVSAGGSQVRVVLANSLGTLPLRIGAASVAMRDSGSSSIGGIKQVAHIWWVVLTHDPRRRDPCQRSCRPQGGKFF